MYNEYHAFLEKKLTEYPYKKDYTHDFEGIKIDIPMVYEGASTIMHLMPIKIEDARKFIPDNRVKPVCLLPGVTLLAINIFDYRKCATGPYNEFTFSVPVRFEPKVNLPVLPLIFDQSFSNFGFYVIKLGATNTPSRGHIVDIWGYPTYEKDLDIELRVTDTCVLGAIREDGVSILEIEEALPQDMKCKFTQKHFNTYFAHNDTLRHVELNTLLFEKMWLGNKNFSIKIGEHKIGQILKDLKVGDKKIATIFYPAAIEIAGRANTV